MQPGNWHGVRARHKDSAHLAPCACTRRSPQPCQFVVVAGAIARRSCARRGFHYLDSVDRPQETAAELTAR